MPSLWDEPHRSRACARIRALTPDAPARWGRLTAREMIAHLGDQLRVGLGELSGPPIAGPLRNPVLRWLALYVLPMPKGRLQTPPVLLTTRPGQWESDQSTVLALVERCAACTDDHAWGESPVFGRLSKGQWGALSYKHFDHHLRQFGG